MSPDTWKIVGYVAGVIAGLYALVGLLLFLFQAKLVYFPSLDMEGSPSDAGLAFEPVSIKTVDGVTLSGWFVLSNQHSVVLLFLHGNGGNISHRLESLRQFHAIGFSTLIIDYRGYGQSEGETTEEGTYRDAEAAWKFLTIDRGIREEDIVLLGRSLGGAIAAHLATLVKPRALVLESTFTSIPDRGSEIYPYFPVRLLSRIEYNTLSKLQAVRCPVLVVHSPEDEIVPFNHGQRLFNAATPPKEFLQIQGGHNDGNFVSGERYTQGLRSFIDRN